MSDQRSVTEVDAVDTVDVEQHEWHTSCHTPCNSLAVVACAICTKIPLDINEHADEDREMKMARSECSVGRPGAGPGLRGEAAFGTFERVPNGIWDAEEHDPADHFYDSNAAVAVSPSPVMDAATCSRGSSPAGRTASSSSLLSYAPSSGGRGKKRQFVRGRCGTEDRQRRPKEGTNETVIHTRVGQQGNTIRAGRSSFNAVVGVYHGAVLSDAGKLFMWGAGALLG